MSDSLRVSVNELEFDFVGALSVKVFDGRDHGLSHCMKAVDVIVKYPDRELFVEVKDPNHTNAPASQRAKFQRKLTPQHSDSSKRDKFVDELVGKCRDSWLYRWAQGQDKPVYYAVLVELAGVEAPTLQAISDLLERKLPARHETWVRPFVTGAAVLDIAGWNRLGSYGTVRRAPVSSTTNH